MVNLANYHAEMGDIETARELRERTYEDFQRVLGPDHPDTLTAMMNLANSLTDTGELAAARKLNEELVEHAGAFWVRSILRLCPR